MPHKGQQLSRRRCRRCRLHKIKCYPVDRSWPAEKCQPCIDGGHACSANLTTLEARQEDAKRSPAQHSGRCCSKGLSLNPVTCHNGNDLHHRDSSALLSSVLGGHVAVARVLLQAGADPNEDSRVHGTLLEAASERGYLEVVKTLIDHGASVNKPARFHSTVLQAAAAHGHADIVQHLLSNGAKLTSANSAVEEDVPFADEMTDQDTIVETMSLDGSSYLKDKAPHSLSPPPSDPFRVLGLGDIFRAFGAGRTFAQGESEEIDEAILDRIFAEHTVSSTYDHDYQQLRKDNLQNQTASGTFPLDPIVQGDEALEQEALSPFSATHSPASEDWTNTSCLEFLNLDTFMQVPGGHVCPYCLRHADSCEPTCPGTQNLRLDR